MDHPPDVAPPAAPVDFNKCEPAKYLHRAYVHSPEFVPHLSVMVNHQQTDTALAAVARMTGFGINPNLVPPNKMKGFKKRVNEAVVSPAGSKLRIGIAALFFDESLDAVHKVPDDVSGFGYRGGRGSHAESGLDARRCGRGGSESVAALVGGDVETPSPLTRQRMMPLPSAPTHTTPCKSLPTTRTASEAAAAASVAVAVTVMR
jgi:hypothetical protein